MAKGGFRGGYPGGNQMNMMKQAQKMQQDFLKMQQELESTRFEFTSGGGAVKAVILGTRQLESIEIKPEVVDPEDVDMLQDLILTAVNGALKSCEITKNAVSQALSDLPIQSCSALYLDGLRRLTDAVGGVTVTVLEDLSYGYASMQVGAEVTLDGAMAERYIRARERTEEGNLKRMERQKQFFTALMKKVLASVKERPASILDLYGKISSDVVTDLETGDILYLATEASGMRIDTNIRNVPGTVTSDENGFVQYDLDEAGLLELLLDVYYEAEE